MQQVIGKSLVAQKMERLTFNEQGQVSKICVTHDLTMSWIALLRDPLLVLQVMGQGVTPDRINLLTKREFEAVKDTNENPALLPNHSLDDIENSNDCLVPREEPKSPSSVFS